MNNLPQFTDQVLAEAFLDPFFTSLIKEIDKGKSLLTNTEELFQSYYKRLKRIDSKNERSKFINETIWLKESLFRNLDLEFPERREIAYAEEFGDFRSSAEQFIVQQKKWIEVEQMPERFHSIESDTAFVKTAKPFKRFAYGISVLPAKIANAFRKDKKPVPYWSHRVPVKNLCHYFFEVKFAQGGLNYFEALQKQKCATLNLIIEIVAEVDQLFNEYLSDPNIGKTELLNRVGELAKQDKIELLKSTLEDKVSLWKAESEKSLEDLHHAFSYSCERAGTIELDNQAFSAQTIQQEETKLKSQYNRIFHGWRNTFFAQIDDLQVDLELYLIKYHSLQQLELLQTSCKNRIQQTVKEQLQLIQVEFEQLKKGIQKQESTKGIRSFLMGEKERIGKRLAMEVVPKTIETIYNQNLPELLSRLEIKVKDQLNQMRAKRIIYSQSTYDSPIPKNDLSHFNPKELVEIDIFVNFSKQISELKSKVVQELESIQVSLTELPSISDYNLESAISSLDDGKAFDEVVSIALAGIERAVSKSEEITQDAMDLEGLIDNELRTAIKAFNEKVVALTENENITQIRLKITKAKALERTEAYRRKIIQNIKGFLPIALHFIRSKFKVFQLLLDVLLKRAGLIDVDEKLTAELSEFLNHTDEAIEKLPYVYKRLYQIKALEDELFFEGRARELNELKSAYINWEKGAASGTCLHGEKGSGASSLINLFTKQTQEFELYRHKFDQAHASEADFFVFFQGLLKDKKLVSYPLILEKLNSGKRKVIVLEDLQHFYLKKINGFEALRNLLELIAASGEQVFWLVEITSYAYTYLQKTVDIERYFRQSIELKKLENQQIVDLILKRHRVSGYKLKFSAEQSGPSQKKKLKTMTPEEGQAFLQLRFFENLNQFAQSNISLALLYWLRSTRSVDDNTIVMAQIQKLNFNFLNKLSSESLFTLHTFLLHDSLTPKEHAQIFHQAETTSRRVLMILEDQGLLSSKENRYYLNRLLYRQVVNTLSNKNIIH